MRVTHESIKERKSIAWPFTSSCFETRETLHTGCIFTKEPDTAISKDICSAIEIYDLCISLRYLEGIRKARRKLCE